MNKKIILAALAAMIPAVVLADLGDTYKESCRRYGSRGHVYKDSMVWSFDKINIQEIFYHNQCVMVYYMPAKGRYLYESAIWDLLKENSRSGDHWTHWNTDSDGNPEYVNADSTIYGKLIPCPGYYPSLRICYASWLKRKGLNHAPNESDGDDNERAPVEDNSDGTPM